MALDAAGNAYVTGPTWSDFPTTRGAFDVTFNGNEDAFVSKLNSEGSGLVYSTYLGGTGFDNAFGLALDAAGNVYVTGVTNSPDFPTTPGAFDVTFNGGRDVFVSKLNAAGSALVYSTYLGGDFPDFVFGVQLDAARNVYVTGSTGSRDFPATRD
nr:SBBP repeat-containing protein [Gemmatimonadota bacterium]